VKEEGEKLLAKRHLRQRAVAHARTAQHITDCKRKLLVTFRPYLLLLPVCRRYRALLRFANMARPCL